MNYEQVHALVRSYGGVCILDEVQTGFGRVGAPYWWAFEHYGMDAECQLIPDILVMGKSMGNGHPVSCVITTKAISASFAKGPIFFSTVCKLFSGPFSLPYV